MCGAVDLVSELPDGQPVFVCHVCGSWVSFDEGGDGCAQEGNDDCECWPGCFFLCAGCWCERAGRFTSALPAEPSSTGPR